MNELLKKKTEIIAWLEKYNIENYTLVEDVEYGYVVDVDGSADISDKKLTKIPIKFGKVSEDFHCHSNQLTSLEGGPTSLSGNFYCSDNQLTSLEGGPTSVGGHFYCVGNQLTNLLGGPDSVGGDFYCGDNQLANLEGSPTSVGGSFGCQNSQVISLEYCPTSVGENFYCHDNSALEEYQNMTDLSAIKEKLLSDKEKKLLEKSIATTKKNTLYKV